MPAEGYHSKAAKKMRTTKSLAVYFNSAGKSSFCFYHLLYLAKVRVYLSFTSCQNAE